MAKQKSHGFLEGALILGVSAIIVKAIGALFKVPLANILGGTGMGYFMTAYDLFNPIRSLAIAGIPVAVSKMVAESIAVGRFNDARRIFHSSLAIVTVTGIVGSLLLYFSSDIFAAAVGNPQATLSLITMSPAIFCCCIVSAYRGYYEGMRNMYPTAVSQVAEAVIKLICGIFFAQTVVEIGLGQFQSGGLVFGQTAHSLDEAMAIITPVTSSAAIFGISVSTAAALLFLVVRHSFCRGEIQKEQFKNSPPARSFGSTVREIAAIAVPVCLGAVAINIASMVDLFSVINRTTDAIAINSKPFIQQYGYLLNSGVSLQELPNYLYGSYTGLVLTIFNIVPAITIVFGISALPTVSAAWATRNTKKTQESIVSVLRVVAIVAIPAGMGITAMARPILMLFFPAKSQEIEATTRLLEILGPAVIFTSLLAPVNSMLQAIGRADLPVKLMFLGAAIKAAVNFIFIGIPEINIIAAPIGTMLCYAFIICASIAVLVGATGIKIPMSTTFIRPAVAGIACGFAARNSYKFMFGMAQNQIITILSIGIGAIIYFILLFILKIVTKDDLLMLKQYKKI